MSSVSKDHLFCAHQSNDSYFNLFSCTCVTFSSLQFHVQKQRLRVLPEAKRFGRLFLVLVVVLLLRIGYRGAAQDRRVMVFR